MMASGIGLAGDDDADPLLRPAWEETEDETDVDLGLRRPQAHPASLQDPSTPADAWRALLVPLCAARWRRCGRLMDFERQRVLNPAAVPQPNRVG
jgi:hypothetical protein